MERAIDMFYSELLGAFRLGKGKSEPPAFLDEEKCDRKGWNDINLRLTEATPVSRELMIDLSQWLHTHIAGSHTVMETRVSDAGIKYDILMKPDKLRVYVNVEPYNHSKSSSSKGA